MFLPHKSYFIGFWSKKFHFIGFIGYIGFRDFIGNVATLGKALFRAFPPYFEPSFFQHFDQLFKISD